MIANSAYLAKFPVMPDRHRHALEHHVIQKHGIQHAIAHLQHKRYLAAVLRQTELEIKRVMKIVQTDIGEPIACRRPHPTIGRSDFRQNITTVLINRTDRRYGRSDYDRMTGTIGIGNFMCRVRDLENLELIDVVRLEHLVAKIQLKMPVLDMFETQLIYVPCLKRGSNAVGK